jgi:hypothetical protein
MFVGEKRSFNCDSHCNRAHGYCFIKLLGVYVLNVPVVSKVFVSLTLKLYTLLRRGLMIRFVIAVCSLIIILFSF